MDTDEDTDEEQEDAPLVASDEQARREARLRHEPTVWSDNPLSNVPLVRVVLRNNPPVFLMSLYHLAISGACRDARPCVAAELRLHGRHAGAG